MAAWQTEFHVVPRRALAATPLSGAQALAGTRWWAGATLPADYRERLDAAGPRAPAASPEVEAWGPDDGNRVEVRRDDDGHVASVRVRIDVRRLDAKFAAALIGFVRAADAVLVRADGYVTAATAGGLGLSLRGSAAWRFVQEPRARLERSRDGGDEDDDDDGRPGG